MKVGWIVVTKDGRMDHGTLEAESPEKVEQFMRSDPNVESVLALEQVEPLITRVTVGQGDKWHQIKSSVVN